MMRKMSEFLLLQTEVREKFRFRNFPKIGENVPNLKRFRNSRYTSMSKGLRK